MKIDSQTFRAQAAGVLQLNTYSQVSVSSQNIGPDCKICTKILSNLLCLNRFLGKNRNNASHNKMEAFQRMYVSPTSVGQHHEYTVLHSGDSYNNENMVYFYLEKIKIKRIYNVISLFIDLYELSIVVNFYLDINKIKICQFIMT